MLFSEARLVEVSSDRQVWITKAKLAAMDEKYKEMKDHMKIYKWTPLELQEYTKEHETYVEADMQQLSRQKHQDRWNLDQDVLVRGEVELAMAYALACAGGGSFYLPFNNATYRKFHARDFSVSKVIDFMGRVIPYFSRNGGSVELKIHKVVTDRLPQEMADNMSCWFGEYYVPVTGTGAYQALTFTPLYDGREVIHFSLNSGGYEVQYLWAIRGTTVHCRAIAHGLDHVLAITRDTIYIKGKPHIGKFYLHGTACDTVSVKEKPVSDLSDEDMTSSRFIVTIGARSYVATLDQIKKIKEAIGTVTDDTILQSFRNRQKEQLAALANHTTFEEIHRMDVLDVVDLIYLVMPRDCMYCHRVSIFNTLVQKMFFYAGFKFKGNYVESVGYAQRLKMIEFLWTRYRNYQLISRNRANKHGLKNLAFDPG